MVNDSLTIILFEREQGMYISEADSLIYRSRFTIMEEGGVVSNAAEVVDQWR